MVLHHFGDSTLSDVKELEKECVAAGAKTVVVAGDIAKPETAKDVSLLPCHLDIAFAGVHDVEHSFYHH